MEGHDLQKPTSRFGPIASPVDHFEHLPEHTRRYLERITEEDIATLKSVIRSFERASIVGWFLKWLGLLTAGTFTATVTFGEGIRKIYAWWLVG